VQREKGGSEVTTWEEVETIKIQFPNFNLEDMVVFVEGSIVRHNVKSKDREWKQRMESIL